MKALRDSKNRLTAIRLGACPRVLSVPCVLWLGLAAGAVFSETANAGPGDTEQHRITREPLTDDATGTKLANAGRTLRVRIAICHRDETLRFSPIMIPSSAVADHLGHGDCLIDDGVDCTVDRCDPALGCVHEPNDGACDDGLFCTTETCTDEGCIAVSTCPPMINGCVFVNDSCDEDNDVCVDVPDHGQCDDSDICTSDTCDSQTGICGNEPLNCDDENPCTIDECDPGTGCTHRAKCDDSNLCTSDNCNPSTGQCINFEAGCFDMDPCTAAGICDPATGQCTFPPIDCDDENPCTTDRCQGGTCAYDPVACDDDNPCTDDYCDPVIGCTSAPKNCDDGNLCNGSEICSPTTGDCVPNPLSIVLPCIDNNVCTTDSCVPSTGECVFTPITCDDNDPCTVNACDPSSGCTYPPVSCNDNNACTQDFCDPSFGCRNLLNIFCGGLGCSESVCDPATGLCVSTPGTCPDLDDNSCTVATCSATGCGPEIPVDALCDDGIDCTTDHCIPPFTQGGITLPGGCQHELNDTACRLGICNSFGSDHGHACMDSQDCPTGTCVPLPCVERVCDPDNEFADGSGCVGSWVSCDDGDRCTSDSCALGSDGRVDCVFIENQSCPCLGDCPFTFNCDGETGTCCSTVLCGDGINCCPGLTCVFSVIGNFCLD